MAAYQQANVGEGSKSSNHFGGTSGSSVMSDDQIAELNAYFGFDKPIIVSYFDWLMKVFQFDLGESLRYHEPVWDIIKARFPVSLFYGFITTFLAYLISIPLGIIKGIKHHSLFDTASSFLIFVGYAVPNFVFGIFLLLVFAFHFEVFPLGGFMSDDFSDMSLWQQIMDLFDHGFLPILSYMVGQFALMTVLMKNSLMDNIASDYVRTAMAKGLTYKKTVFRHALRNSLIPLATHFGNNISLILTGSLLVEKIFNIDGMGLLGYESVVERDFSVVMGLLVISSLLLMIGNILSDICVALVDPRVQFK